MTIKFWMKILIANGLTNQKKILRIDEMINVPGTSGEKVPRCLACFRSLSCEIAPARLLKIMTA